MPDSPRQQNGAPHRDEKGRFKSGGPGGPGRRRRDRVPGDALVALARPLSSFDLLELRSDLSVMIDQAERAAGSELTRDQLLKVHLHNRHLAAMVLNKRLSAEACGEA